MQRRKFLKDSGKIAIGIGVFGAISWENNHFVGDTPTTSDILGPFYRPNAPLRTNINPPVIQASCFTLAVPYLKKMAKHHSALPWWRYGNATATKYMTTLLMTTAIGAHKK
jgi:hypothetical protein